MLSELQKVSLWTGAISLPLAAASYFFCNVHNGPGGYWFLLGVFLAWPALFLGPALASIVPETILSFLLFASLLPYWAILVIVVRKTWRLTTQSR
jgi:hypothetical protein